MPFLIMLGVAASFLTRYIVTKVMLAVGLGFVTYLGVDTLVDVLETQLLTSYGNLPAYAWQMASLCGLDIAITILVSTLALSMQIKMIVAGAKILTNIGR